MSDLGNFQQNSDGNHLLLTDNDVSVVVVTAAGGGSSSSSSGGGGVGDSSNSGAGSGALAVGNVPIVRRTINRFSPVSNQLRKRFLTAIASKHSSSTSASSSAATAATISAKRQKTNNTDENQHKQQSSNMNMSEGDGGERRLNFSAVGTGANGSVLKMPTNSASKPGDIRKLVIKNFKGL